MPSSGVLLDPFVGSSMTLAAALDNGPFKVIGIDKEAKYLRMAAKRVRDDCLPVRATVAPQVVVRKTLSPPTCTTTTRPAVSIALNRYSTDSGERRTTSQRASRDMPAAPDWAISIGSLIVPGTSST